MTTKMNRLMIYLAFLCISVFSCKKVETNLYEDKILNKALTINEAKNFYNIILNKKEIIASTNSIQFQNQNDAIINRAPVWEHAKTKLFNGGGNSIMVPLNMGPLFQNTSENGVMNLKDLNYLFMYKKSNGEIISEWISLFPSSTWSKGQREKYRGIIEVKDWNGTIKKHFYFDEAGNPQNIQISNNKQNYKMTKTKQANVQNSTNSCIEIIIYKWDCNCTSALPENWSYGWVVESVKTFCYSNDSGGSSGLPGYGSHPGNPSGPETGGGGEGWTPGPGDYTPPTCNPNEPGCSNGGGEVWLDPNDMTPITPYDILLHNFPTMYIQISSLNNINPPVINNLAAYLLQNDFTYKSLELTKWFIDENNKGLISWEEFDNWFLKVPEYTDDENFINEDLITFDETIIQSSLPSLNNFTTHFPKKIVNGKKEEMEATEVYELVGGSLYTNHLSGNYVNACAIRGSRGLLYSGIHIPILRYNGVQRTEKGNDQKNYILDAVSFNKFMINKFGVATHTLTGIDANDHIKVSALLKGKTGIYVIINSDGSSSGARYSGHVDFIENGVCLSGAYTSPKGGVKSIRIWVLN